MDGHDPLSPDSKPQPSRPFRLSILALGAVAALVIWLLLRWGGAPIARPSAPPKPVPPAPAEPVPVAPKKKPKPPPQAEPSRAPQGPVVVGAAPDAPHLPGMVPHPLTSERIRIQQQNQMIQALNDAMDLGNAKRMRELIPIYEKLDPDDENALVAGYEVIADCIEHPEDEAALDAARRYYHDERASTLRRFVRRHCFGGKRP